MKYERFQGYLNDRQFMIVDHDECEKLAHHHYDLEPNFVCYNPENYKKNQSFWLINDPVHCQVDAKARKPYRYLRAIEAAYDAKYGGDIYFSRSIHRNPLFHGSDTDWRHDRGHSLAQLAEVIDLNPDKTKAGKRLVTDKKSRNVTLFNDLRFWSYKHAKEAREHDYDQWHKKVMDRAMAYNTFENPNRLSVVITIARSVAEFSYFRYRVKGAVITDEYRAAQAQRGRIGGLKSKGGGRPKVDEKLIAEIKLLKNVHKYSVRKIASELGISKTAVSKYAK